MHACMYKVAKTTKHSGFTLLELLVVMVIIGLLAGTLNRRLGLPAEVTV